MAAIKLQRPEYLRTLESNLARGIWKYEDNSFLHLLREHQLEEPDQERRRKRLLTRLALSGVIREPAQPGRHEYHGLLNTRGKYSHLSVAIHEGSFTLWTSIGKRIKLYTAFNTEGRVTKVSCRAIRENGAGAYPIEPLTTIPFDPMQRAWTEKAITLRDPEHSPQTYIETFAIPAGAPLGVTIAATALQKTQRLARDLADALWEGSVPEERDPVIEFHEAKHPLHEIEADLPACMRVGNIARLWLEMDAKEDACILKYKPFTFKEITTSLWLRHIKYIR